jgi:hypothetical protein
MLALSSRERSCASASIGSVTVSVSPRSGHGNGRLVTRPSSGPGYHDVRAWRTNVSPDLGKSRLGTPVSRPNTPVALVSFGLHHFAHRCRSGPRVFTHPRRFIAVELGSYVSGHYIVPMTCRSVQMNGLQCTQFCVLVTSFRDPAEASGEMRSREIACGEKVGLTPTKLKMKSPSIKKIEKYYPGRESLHNVG